MLKTIFRSLAGLTCISISFSFFSTRANGDSTTNLPQGVSGVTETFTDSLFKSVGDDVLDDFIGWGFSAFEGGGFDPSYLSPIIDELNQIKTDLEGVVTELGQIDKAIAAIDCVSTILAGLAPAKNIIKGWLTRYTTAVQNPNSSTQKDLKAMIEEILDPKTGGTGAMQMIINMNGYMTGPHGAIADCRTNAIKKLAFDGTGGTVEEVTVFKRSNSVFTYYYAFQLKAL